MITVYIFNCTITVEKNMIVFEADKLLHYLPTKYINGVTLTPKAIFIYAMTSGHFGAVPTVTVKLSDNTQKEAAELVDKIVAQIDCP